MIAFSALASQACELYVYAGCGPPSVPRTRARTRVQFRKQLQQPDMNVYMCNLSCACKSRVSSTKGQIMCCCMNEGVKACSIRILRRCLGRRLMPVRNYRCMYRTTGGTGDVLQAAEVCTLPVAALSFKA